jgi:hypothetical protein
MNLFIWLDLPLMALGLLAMSPGFWHVFHLRGIGRRSPLGRGLRTATALLFSLGLSAFTAGGVDAGLAKWDEVCRAKDNDNPRQLQESMMAPDFSLPSLDEGRTIRLSDYRGRKPVVLIFGNFY